MNDLPDFIAGQTKKRNIDYREVAGIVKDFIGFLHAAEHNQHRIALVPGDMYPTVDDEGMLHLSYILAKIIHKASNDPETTFEDIACCYSNLTALDDKEIL